MSVVLDKACGVDVHKDIFVATMAFSDGSFKYASFGTTSVGLSGLRDWVVSNGCGRVAFESTGVYWKMLYRVLEPVARVFVANPYKVKKPVGKKTDKVDSEWLAVLCLKNMIVPSRVFGGDRERLRELTRYRESLVKSVGRFKNRVHKFLESCSVKLGSVLSDIFGKNGRRILKDLLKGKNIDSIMEDIKDTRIKKKEGRLREALRFGLDPVSVLLIKNSLDRIESIERDIKMIDGEIKRLATSFCNDELKILMSIPGFGFISSATLIAEIGDIKDFENGERLVSWCGMAPSVYQSAGKLTTGKITKQGSKHIRRMLVQIAHTISRTDNKLSTFYHHIEEKKGPKKAAIALSRKLLTIMHHLLTNNEEYNEPTTAKPKIKKLPKEQKPETQPPMTIEEMINVLIKAGHEIKKYKYDLQGGL